ncbi:hypothetical protein [Asaia platycodi]|uniref:hypothetical protein n=1 Tax=Asaia platycodi TaxID=610243 RepID=UPI00047276CF|nr:hypothetical protein [Asaia platycodi]
MSDLKSLASIQNMIAAVAGKHESPAIKADLAIAGSAASLLVQTLLPRVDPTLDLAGLDAGLAQGFDGFTAAITAVQAPIATEALGNA